MTAVFVTLHLAIGIYWWIIIASAIFSWLYAFNVVNARNPLVASIGNALYRLTEPALRPIRRIVPDLGGLDISPIILLLALTFIEIFMHTTVEPLFGIVH
jgi:YggT family protein